MSPPTSASTTALSRFSKWRRVLIFPAVLLLVVLLFYGEEDWRGKRAWEMCKRDLAAKGQILDAQSLIPLRVPDDQNILKAPKMADWFGGHFYAGVTPSTDLSARLSSRRWPVSVVIAQFTVLPPDTTATNSPFKPTAPPADKADTNVVEMVDLPGYDSPVKIAHVRSNGPGAQVVDLVSLDGVLLTDAIRSLAKQAGRNIQFDPILTQNGFPVGTPARNPTITEKWSTITADQALFALPGR
jgi:hypothetical protein